MSSFSWKRELYEEIAKEFPITQLTPDVPRLSETDKKDYWDFSRFDVYVVELDRSKPDEKILISGNRSLIPFQLSLLRAQKALLDFTLGDLSGDSFPGGGTVKRAGSPLVKLFFLEDRPENAPDDWKATQGTMSFRLMDISERDVVGKAKITWQFIEKLAKDIYQEFQKPNNEKGFIWEKGRQQVNYSDWDMGYGLKVLCRNKRGGEELIKKILKVRNHAFDTSKVSLTIPDESAYPDNPGTIRVLGEEIQLPKRRPIARVRFRKAWLELQLKKEKIPLIVRGQLASFDND